MQNSQSNIPKYFTLSELAGSLQSVIEKNYKKAYWIKSEILKLNYYPKSGHCYPDLVEKKDGKVLATMRGIIWKGIYADITRKFQMVTKEELREGMTVLLLMRVTFSPVHGLSLNILDIEPSFTLGEMAREKAETINKLKAEGIFDANRMLEIPLVPKNLAIISVETSKGYSDFIRTLTNNKHGYYFHLSLFPALLQGDGAVASITGQLKIIKNQKEQFDVVLIIRGGGGDVGLNCYDNYHLAKEVATFPLPVLTGIGHSTNETVTEIVANKNLITPTAAADFIIQKFEDFEYRITNAEDKIISLTKQIIASEKQKLDNNGRIIVAQTQKLLLTNNHLVKELGTKFVTLTRQFLVLQKNELQNTVSGLKYKPFQILSNNKMTLLSTVKIIDISSKQILKDSKIHIERVEEKLKLLEPSNVMKRGYSITIHNGRPVRNINQIKIGDRVETKLYDGSFESVIEKTENYGKQSDIQGSDRRA